MPASFQSNPIYLHFLDRELGNSVDFALSAPGLDRLLGLLILGTTSNLYCGLSLLWENPATTTTLSSLVKGLVETDQLDLVSHHATLDEFIDTRRRLYRHDQQRYAGYFADAGQDRLGPTLTKPNPTTTALESRLAKIVGAQHLDTSLEFAKDLQIIGAVEEGLRIRADRAITFSLFSQTSKASELGPTQVRGIRRLVSIEYCRDYLEFADGILPTGVRGLDLYDNCFPLGFPQADLTLIEWLLGRLGLGFVLGTAPGDARYFWDEAILARATDEGSISRHIQDLLSLATQVDNAAQASPSTVYARRQAILGLLQRWTRDVDSNTESDPLQALGGAIDQLRRLLDRLESSAELRSLRASANLAERVDVLLITATDLETQVLFELIERRFSREPSLSRQRSMRFTRFGIIGDFEVVHVRCQMGTSGVTGSLTVTARAIEILQPQILILVGIAFGVDPSTQELGTVLVADAVFPYESGKISTGSGGIPLWTPRGIAIPCDPTLVDVLVGAPRPADLKVQRGLVASGPVLVAHSGVRDELVERHSVIGGEMEGAGVGASALQARTPWALAKAICDFGDDEKDTDKDVRQTRAAQNSYVLTFEALKDATHDDLRISGIRRSS